jgi:valacyclovir hydrolase
MPHFTTEGCRIFYRETGAGKPVVVLPGNTASSMHHQGDLVRLGQRYHAVSPDYRGTGESGRIAVWPDDWWMQNAHDVAALIHHLQYEQAILIGISGGAAVALWCSILFPDAVTAVVADSVGHHLKPGIIQAEIANRRLYNQETADFWQHGHGADWRQVIEADCDLLLRFADRGGQLFDERLTSIQCPVLFTGSTNDEFYPDLQIQFEQMSQQIPNSQIHMVNGGGHPLIWSCADEFYAVVEPFLEKVTK